MSTTLRQQFETFADCCLELARRAGTPALRSRLTKMAVEYQQATVRVGNAAPAGPDEMDGHA